MLGTIAGFNAYAETGSWTAGLKGGLITFALSTLYTFLMLRFPASATWLWAFCPENRKTRQAANSHP
jgi:hypothetical protein